MEAYGGVRIFQGVEVGTSAFAPWNARSARDVVMKGILRFKLWGLFMLVPAIVFGAARGDATGRVASTGRTAVTHDAVAQVRLLIEASDPPLTSLQAWFTSARLGLNDGAAVAVWPNYASGMVSQDLAQTTGSLQPTMQRDAANLINGRAVVQTTDVEEYVTALYDLDAFPLSGGVTYFIVFKSGSPTACDASDGLFQWSELFTSTLTFLGLSCNTTGNGFRFNVDGDWRLSWTAASSTVYVAILRWDGAEWSLQVNGNQVTVTGSPYADISPISQNRANYLFLFEGLDALYEGLSVTELGIYNVGLSNADRTLLTTFLCNRYAVTCS